MQRTLTDNRFLIFPFLTLLILLLLIPAAAALPNGTETIITPGTAGSFQWNPAISGDVIAWDDQRAGGGMNIVYAYNLVTGREYPVLPDPSNPYLWQFAPSVRGDWIVWQQDDYVTYSIVAYNNATLETISIPAVPRNADWYGYLTEPSDNVMPRTNGTAVVWQDYTNNPYWGVYLYDLSAGSGGSAEPIIADPAFDQKSPDISGDYIVYENWSSGDSDIYLYFGSNRTSVQVSASPDDDLSPAVDGHRIVWQRYNTTSGYHAVYSHDILTGETRQVTPQGSPFSQTRPGISGDLVVVEDGRNVTAQQIYAYDLSLSPPREIWVTPDSEMMKKNPAISGNRVVWEDYRNSPLGNDADIYLSTLGPAEICPAADFSITPSAADPGDTVLFSAAAAQPGASPISHVLWNFGDGSPEELSGDLTATHQYAGDGVYAVTLIVENPECRTISAETCSHEVFVNSPPVADFTLNPEYGLAPLTVQFTDTSTSLVTSWYWEFGPG
jgi:beta propeller repeat protein